MKILTRLHMNPQPLRMIRIVNFLFDPDKITPVAEHVSVCSCLFFFFKSFFKGSNHFFGIGHTEPLPFALCGFLLGNEKSEIEKQNEASALASRALKQRYACLTL